MKKKIILILVVILFLAVSFFLMKHFKRGSNSQVATPQSSSESPQPAVSEKDPPRIVSTKPENLDNSIIPAFVPLEFTFNRPLENEGEFKIKIEPKVDFKVTVSNERKTGVVTFQKPLELGTSYTLFIGTETKFTGMGRWGEEKVFHFRTIPYKGL